MAAHFFLTYYAGWMAFVFALPGDYFLTSSAYRVFPMIMPEADWTFFLTGACAFGMVGIFWAKARVLSMLTLALTHGAVAGMMALAGPINLGMGIYAGLAAHAFFTVVQEKLISLRS